MVVLSECFPNIVSVVERDERRYDGSIVTDRQRVDLRGGRKGKEREERREVKRERERSKRGEKGDRWGEKREKSEK